MRIEERLEMLHQLALVSGWTLDEFKAEVRDKYPNGETPNGPQWTDERLAQIYNTHEARND